MAKLYFYYSSMNAGKSPTLLQADFNYRERGMQTMLWTAALDDRGGDHAIESRSGCMPRPTGLLVTPRCGTGSPPRTGWNRWPACWSTSRSS